MALSAYKTPFTSGLMALLIGASACTSVTRKDVWKSEKEFSQTLPAGQREVTEYTTEILSERKGDSIDLRVVESAVKKTFNVYTLQSNRRERQYVEETKESHTRAANLGWWGVGTAVGAAVLVGGIIQYNKYYPGSSLEQCSPVGEYNGKIINSCSDEYHEDPRNDKTEEIGGVMIASGVVLTLVSGTALLVNISDGRWEKEVQARPTDILRVSQAGNKEVTEQQGEPQVLYKQTPQAGIEIIAESDFFTLNSAQQRASFLTDQQGRAKLIVQLPTGYSLREKQLYNALMPKVEEGSMQLADVKGYVQQHAGQHTLTLKTALPEREGVNVRKNAAQTITYTVYELPK